MTFGATQCVHGTRKIKASSAVYNASRDITIVKVWIYESERGACRDWAPRHAPVHVPVPIPGQVGRWLKSTSSQVIKLGGFQTDKDDA